MAYGRKRTTVPSGWGQWLDSAIKQRFTDGVQWTWADFGRAMGVKHATVTRWLEGGLPEATKVRRVAQVLGVSVIDLLALMEGAVQSIQTAPQTPPHTIAELAASESFAPVHEPLAPREAVHRRKKK